jgi:D-sedoheptulose 7-phosphate isomerase
MRHALEAARRVLDECLASDSLLRAAEQACDMLVETLRRGGTILVVGNGGSCCDAAHFVEELTGRYRAPLPGKPDRPPLAAIGCKDAAHITCVANDYGFDQVFSRWVTALGRSGDTLVVLSTSGNSANILHAIEAAEARSMPLVALLGRGGGRAAACVMARPGNACIIVPGAQTASERIQEIHMLLLHAWVDAIERRLFPELFT